MHSLNIVATNCDTGLLSLFESFFFFFLWNLDENNKFIGVLEALSCYMRRYLVHKEHSLGVCDQNNSILNLLSWRKVV